MNSTFISNSNDLILEVSNLSLIYYLRFHRTRSLRDVFVEALSSKDAQPSQELEKEFFALKDISFKVRRGDRVGILGVNGAGKSSLLRCVAGMLRPQKGKVSAHAQIRSIFSTSHGILPELTGRENAELLAEFFYPEVEDTAALVEEALEFSELGQFLDIPYKDYSNGMQARLYLSLISARPAGILILDEVFDGADQFFKQKVSERVTKIMRESGCTLFVSHSTDQILQSCNRVLVLKKNRLAFDGGTEKGISFYLEQMGN
jgi:ABC-2 type transport system ATP-binding protein